MALVKQNGLDLISLSACMTALFSDRCLCYLTRTQIEQTPKWTDLTLNMLLYIKYTRIFFWGDSGEHFIALENTYQISFL